ncbi:MAG TPA: hypothetical protein EYP19_06445 [Desulfobacterales bacterium]|nr:hypothetical protein [Desulfobacterales bacterium]
MVNDGEINALELVVHDEGLASVVRDSDAHIGKGDEVLHYEGVRNRYTAITGPLRCREGTGISACADCADNYAGNCTLICCKAGPVHVRLPNLVLPYIVPEHGHPTIDVGPTATCHKVHERTIHPAVGNHVVISRMEPVRLLGEAIFAD